MNDNDTMIWERTSEQLIASTVLSRSNVFSALEALRDSGENKKYRIITNGYLFRAQRKKVFGWETLQWPREFIFRSGMDCDTEEDAYKLIQHDITKIKKETAKWQTIDEIQ